MIKGKSIFILVNDVVVALCTSCSYHSSALLAEKAGASGEWKEYDTKSITWEMRSSHLVAYETFAIGSGDAVKLSMGEVKDGKLSPTGMSFEGIAYLSSGNITATKGENVTQQMTFCGTDDAIGKKKEVYFITSEGKALVASNNQYFIHNY